MVTEMHQRLVEELAVKGLLGNLRLRAAFQAVRREHFLPGVDLERVYRDDAVTTHIGSAGASRTRAALGRPAKAVPAARLSGTSVSCCIPPARRCRDSGLASLTMGMHHGIVAASASEADLLAELERHAGEFVVGAPVGNPYDAEPAATDQGWRMAIGARGGQAFLLDSSMVISNSADMLVAMSARLGTVVGCGAETVSGSYWLTAARDGGLLRFVFVQHAGMTRGMAMGDPLPSEGEHPIEDFDGEGLLAAMATLGLDARRWLDAGPAVVVDYDGARFPEDGPIEQVRSAHYQRYKRPEDEWLSEIVAVERRLPERERPP